ncbi:MAG: hypothetical protein GTO63_15875 [Anaerolineae bacterium]|nr:hypothetical protein [Anaerolineae bacterium]NIN96305.1 hypothetical protein [Anaerolineae bacterium]NIQ79325.1 hypothetical protein [Anaerolineae bacterium]
MLYTYTSCPHCGGLTACYCYTPGRQIADQYADVLTHLHAVLDGFGQYHLNDRIFKDIVGSLIEAGGIR